MSAILISRNNFTVAAQFITVTNLNVCHNNSILHPADIYNNFITSNSGESEIQRAAQLRHLFIILIGHETKTLSPHPICVIALAASTRTTTSPRRNATRAREGGAQTRTLEEFDFDGER